MRKLVAGGAAVATFLSTAAAFGAQPEPWQWRFQPAATKIMEGIEWFEVYTLWFIIPITLLGFWSLSRLHLRLRELSTAQDTA